MSREIVCDRCGATSKTLKGFSNLHKLDVCKYAGINSVNSNVVFSADLCNSCVERLKEFITINDIKTNVIKELPTHSNGSYKVGDIFDFELTTGEKVQALAVKEVGEDMLFILYDCLNKEYTMNEILNNGVLDEIYKTFPSDIKSLMKPFESGYLRLPTEKEIFGCNEYGEDEGDEVEQFEPMKLRRNRIASQGLNGNHEWWWLANKTVASGSYFARVNSYGDSNRNSASGACGVRPLFLIKNL